MDGNRVLYASHTPIEDKSTHPVGKYPVVLHTLQFEVYLHEAEGTSNEFWYWDENTKTIRSVANGEMCLTWDHTNAALKTGIKAVVRPCAYGESEKQGLRYHKETYAFTSDANAKLCLSTFAAKNEEETNSGFATCADKDLSQNWYPFYDYQATGPHWKRLQN
jgi:hypothetical protein